MKRPASQRKPAAKPRTRFKTYTVARARRQFARLLADVAAGCIVEIVDKGRAVASMLDSDTLETLEILANPDAMKTIRDYEAGRMKFHDLSELEAEWAAQDAAEKKTRLRFHKLAAKANPKAALEALRQIRQRIKAKRK